MHTLPWPAWCVTLLLTLTSLLSATEPEPNWIPTGWGGGGYFYAAAFHPTRNGVIYLAGDVNGVYKSEDGGKTWRIINKGLSGYGVFSLAVDRNQPETIWAATDEGLSKSTDGGETWKTIPNSGRKELRLTGEKVKATHNIAIDPSNPDVVYIGTAHGKIYKTIDGGQNWTKVFDRPAEPNTAPAANLQIGGVSSAIFGGGWASLKVPESINADNVSGVGLSVRTIGEPPRDLHLVLTISTGHKYRSKNLHDLMAAGDLRDVVLTPDDFTPDTSKNAVPNAPAKIDLSAVNRFDISGVHLASAPYTIQLSRIFFTTGTGDQQQKVTALELQPSRTLGVYGNARSGAPQDGPVQTVVVSPQDPSVIAAATTSQGLIMSHDGGQTWKTVHEIQRATAIVFAPSNPQILFATSRAEGIWKSTDGGATWTRLRSGIDDKVEMRDVVVSPENPDHVYAVGQVGWSGRFFYSTDGGASWSVVTQMQPDPVGNPTLPAETANGANVAISVAPNLAINPLNPQQLFIAANWRNAISHDGGRTWHESSRGADISCVADIRFHDGKVYTASMDEGVMVSEDNGQTWKQYWPLRHSDDLSGHYWRLDIREVNGQTRIISTSSPWARQYNQVVISEDGGKTFKAYRSGLPDYLPTANTMWGRAYARALAVDPTDPNIVYLGIDGDPTPGRSGGGFFKSADGGKTWQQPANQPGSRRMFFGLAVDPTQPKRLYWGACGSKGGLYRSEDGGETWERVFSKDEWVFNVHVTSDGTVYCLGKVIHRSTDHGNTWTPLAKLPGSGTVVGFEVHPEDPNTLWAVVNYWSGDAQNGGVYKTTDGGKTWTEITGNLPYRRPLVLRYNPATKELWAGYVGLYRLKQ